MYKKLQNAHPVLVTWVALVMIAKTVGLFVGFMAVVFPPTIYIAVVIAIALAAAFGLIAQSRYNGRVDETGSGWMVLLLIANIILIIVAGWSWSIFLTTTSNVLFLINWVIVPVVLMLVFVGVAEEIRKCNPKTHVD